MDRVINIHYQNENGMIFNSEDWYYLRKEYRIIGKLIGGLPSVPRQNIFHGLPMILLPEQIIFLVKNNFCKLIEYTNILKKPDEACVEQFNKKIDEIYEIQKQNYFKNRRKEIEEKLDRLKNKQIKKKKVCQILDSEKFVGKELNKNVNFEKNNMKLMTKLEIDEDHKGAPIEISLENIWSKTNFIKYKTFEDLWKKGYYVSEGLNFGGDFLVYLGDPIEFHANYIIKCLHDSNELKILNKIALNRLATTVRKNMVYAYFQQNTEVVQYDMKTEWIEIKKISENISPR